MNVGVFRHAIQLQKRTTVKDERGNAISSWETVAQTFAAVRDVSGRDFFAAAAHQVENVVTFTLRWRSGLTSDMRIVFAGAPYEIIQINHLGYNKRDFMSIKARVMQGEGEPYGQL